MGASFNYFSDFYRGIFLLSLLLFSWNFLLFFSSSFSEYCFSPIWWIPDPVAWCLFNQSVSTDSFSLSISLPHSPHQIENQLATRSGKFPSYGGRIQLLHWIIVSKYTYWAQGIPLPASIIKKIKKLTYQFIWDGRKGIPWSQMILPKAEKGLGVSYPIPLEQPVLREPPNFGITMDLSSLNGCQRDTLETTPG